MIQNNFCNDWFQISAYLYFEIKLFPASEQFARRRCVDDQRRKTNRLL